MTPMELVRDMFYEVDTTTLSRDTVCHLFLQGIESGMFDEDPDFTTDVVAVIVSMTINVILPPDTRKRFNDSMANAMKTRDLEVFAGLRDETVRHLDAQARNHEGDLRKQYLVMRECMLVVFGEPSPRLKRWLR